MNRKQAAEKARELVSKMTLEEKVMQLGVNAPEIPRLQVPEYHYWNEGLHGVARGGTATVFPQAIGLAAMFDTEKMQEIGDIISTEARAKYNAAVEYGDRDIYKGLTFWSPNVNIFRDPRWGRGHETYGEDPYLTGELGAAYIRGMQGDGTYLKTAACTKHFAVHSGPEKTRGCFNSEVTPKDLHETYLPAFKKCVEKGKVEILMTAYNAVNGLPMSVNKEFLDMAREEWGFEGHVTSDCLALENLTLEHKYSSSHAQGFSEAFRSGVDLNCGLAIKALLEGVEKGIIQEETITQACTRLFTTRYLLGMNAEDNEYDQISYEVVECKEHLQAAYEAAVESFVLLKNENFLPLKKENLSSVAVIGPNANNRKALVGNYEGTASRYITVLEGIQDVLGDTCRVYYSQGCELMKEKTEPLAKAGDRISEALKIASISDVVFLCLGLDATIEGEAGDAGNIYGAGDKESLGMPGLQQTLLEKVLEVGKPVVLLLQAGSAMTFGGMEKHPNLKAILNLWYPGAQGGKAAADVLFGKKSPEGKLPVTFYASEQELPDFESYSMKRRTYRYTDKNIMYPFGYGLTYSQVLVNKAEWNEKGIAVEVENAGSFDVKETLQMYIRCKDNPDEVKEHRLCGFQKVFLASGEKKVVQIPVSSEAYTLVNEKGETYLASGTYELFVSLCQPDERSVELTGIKPQILEITKIF